MLPPALFLDAPLLRNTCHHILGSDGDPDRGVFPGGAEPEHSGEDPAQHEGRPAVCGAELPEPRSEFLHRVQPQVRTAVNKTLWWCVAPAEKSTCAVCRGPGVEGVAPAEASERLQSFQADFDQLWRKYCTCSGGEELFGLPVNGATDCMTVRHFSSSPPPSFLTVPLFLCRVSGGAEDQEGALPAV